MHVENKGKHKLILGEVSTQGFDDTKLTTEAKYLIYLIQWGKKIALCSYYNGSNSFVFVNFTKVYQFKSLE